MSSSLPKPGTPGDFTRWEASPPGTGGPNGTAGTGIGTDSNPMSAMMPFMMMNGGIGDVFDGMFDFSMDDIDTENSEDDLEEEE